MKDRNVKDQKWKKFKLHRNTVLAYSVSRQNVNKREEEFAVEMQRLEEEAVREAEEQRIAEEKRKEEERLAEEHKREENRIAEQERQEEERRAQAQDATFHRMVEESRKEKIGGPPGGDSDPGSGDDEDDEHNEEEDPGTSNKAPCLQCVLQGRPLDCKPQSGGRKTQACIMCHHQWQRCSWSGNNALRRSRTKRPRINIMEKGEYLGDARRIAEKKFGGVEFGEKLDGLEHRLGALERFTS
ncbi:hypothetical protein F5050DRAFT_1716576 [Lentinula boryana]|uniref:Uncharacterized protein n=1 Tax=Lentinula boryana TaxID=40481 RepID=A0ABQ8PWM9_9AGAR|nr:hypothetical protein F5050DRAFT_1716576 [Lentinula boryana]